MPRKAAEPLEKRGREIILFLGDWDELKHIAASTGTDLRPGVLARMIIRKFIRKTQAKSQLKHTSAAHDLDLDALDTGISDESGDTV